MINLGKTTIRNVTLEQKHDFESQWKEWGIWTEDDILVAKQRLPTPAPVAEQVLASSP
jgi:hypothetical protein